MRQTDWSGFLCCEELVAYRAQSVQPYNWFVLHMGYRMTERQFDEIYQNGNGIQIYWHCQAQAHCNRDIGSTFLRGRHTHTRTRREKGGKKKREKLVYGIRQPHFHHIRARTKCSRRYWKLLFIFPFSIFVRTAETTRVECSGDGGGFARSLQCSEMSTQE